ncbi:rho family-interacting cell polarization regulator 1 isoform X1 [Solea senegalensis]|uniref:Rho family-interacting cell polarization regulator 1 isoform X1 n=2 Tax=Solea senegalensis TaxID=28829 RepID=A0AAV6SXD3_SOLSE|nr:rho family-interacting cell polarization regulator 1-like isoform X1 [Solea senegalensis]KAG7521509.1 rho family-interacting cell polarization regulator 1 isoform X1 [Solea senegalensis]
MYSGYGGSPSRSLSTMSLSVRPVRRLTSRSITRSQSFTGVNSYDKPYRNLSVFSTPGVSRKPSRVSRMFTMSMKSNPPPKVPQPERLDQVFEALKKGLQSYLQVHQIDLDSLTRQMKESKRNSRLGFLYEVDKQVKVTERYIRRLEFHLSKIEELYEAYCLQRRLRDGANKMVKAYTASPGSKEARESLTEANKGYKEYTENMCVLESEMENQLGEFHIKMKGLAGFARLCAGDQYEIFMRYGRQRWKLRGRIELNGKQVWDCEDAVLLPLINDFLSVKVTELKSLANHVVVGSVSCETKDLFAALPQSVAVDINDLGTIKLSLEVTWNPFDKDDQGSVPSTVNKAPSVNKRFSTIFNQSPPDTPSLREQAFYNMLRRREESENGTAWSNSSESSDDSSSPQLSVGGPRNSTHHKGVVVTPEIQPAVTGSSAPQPDISFCLNDSSFQTPPKSRREVRSISEVPITAQPLAESSREEEEGTVSVVTKPVDEEEDPERRSPSATVDGVVNNGLASRSYLRSLSHISESSADGVALTDRSAGESGEVMPLTSGISVDDIEVQVPSRRSPEPHCSAAADVAASPGSPCGEENTTSNNVTDSVTLPQDTPSPVLSSSSSPRTGGMNSNPPSHMNTVSPLECNTQPEDGDGTYVARLVSVEEEVPGAGSNCLSRECDVPVDCGLEDALGAVVSSLDDYRGQFPELQHLEQELKLLQATLKGGRHSRSPSVVSLTVETALGSFDFLNTPDWEEDDETKGDKKHRNGRSLQDRGWDSPSSPTSPLTTGCATLDCTLVVHLKYCSSQLLRLGMFGPLRCGEMYALDRLLREARVLEVVRHISKDNPKRLRQPSDAIPQLSQCQGAVSLWQQCVGQGSVYSVSADNFLMTLSTAYSRVLPEKASSMADTVFLCLVERVLDQRLPRRGGSNRDGVMVTLFQVWTYLEANGISDIETHITELAEEVWLVQRLASCDQDVIVHTLRRPAECSLRRDGLHAVAKLLKDPRGKVSASASSVLRSMAAQPKQREQALVNCLELLEDANVDTRVCGCKALAALKAKESIEQLVYLCQTDKDEVRDAAKQTLLVLGEEGKMAHRHVELSLDSIPRLFAPGSMASTAF